MSSPEPPPDVVVIGGGIAGLTLARDVALARRSVLVLEREDEPGGCVRSHTVGGLLLDRGAESFAITRPAAAELIGELGLPMATPNPAPAWVRHESGQAPLPRGGLLGIPADPRAADVVAVLGRAGSWRARVDGLLPARWGWSAGGLGGVVRRRVGSRVLRRLVDPVAGGVYSTDPDDLDPDIVAPGLRAAARSAGSLTGGVATLRGRPQTSAAPGAAVRGLVGGMVGLTEALVDDVRRAGGQVSCGSSVIGLARARDGRWIVTLDSGSTTPIDAAQVVLAVPPPVADVLLRSATGAAVGHPDPSRSTDVAVVTLVVRSPALDSAPRGTGMLVASRARGVTAKALTHATAKWRWLAEAAGPGVHVLRLSYGRGGDRPGPAGGSPPAALELTAESDLVATALVDAVELLGVALRPADLIDSAMVRYRDGLPAFRPGQAEAVADVRARLADFPGLWIIGAGVAGTGLAAVIGDARAVARKLRNGAAAG